MNSNKENFGLTQSELLALVEKNATLINSLEQQNFDHEEEIKQYQTLLAEIEAENAELSFRIEAIKESKEAFFASLEVQFAADAERIAATTSLEQKEELARFLEVQNESLEKFNNRFLLTTKSRCRNCKHEFYDDENRKESCTMHPGALRYYDCASCKQNECFNCCGFCGNCNQGCKKTFHIPVRESETAEPDF